MAKKRQPSISKIIHTVREQNQMDTGDINKRISEVEKSLNSLELTALAIMEILKRNNLTKVKRKKRIVRKV